MGELVIHIGSHKTGTTSIQIACGEVLNGPDGSRDARYLALKTNAYGLVSVSGRRAGFRATLHTRAAERLLRPEAARNIVSSEGFFWLHEAEEVGKLAEIVRARFDRVTILAYLRRQDLLAVSHRGQVMNRAHAARFYGIRATPLPEYAPYMHRYFDYAAKLHDLWGDAFGVENLQVVPFERDRLAGGDVVADFAMRTGINLSGAGAVRRNVSPSGDRLLVGLKLAEMGVSNKIRRKLFRHLEDDNPFLPSRAEAQAFLAHFAESNARLSRLFSFEGAPFGFSPSFDMYPRETGEQWSNERVGKIVDVLLRRYVSDLGKG